MVLISNDTFKTNADMSDIYKKCLKKFEKYNITIITNDNFKETNGSEEPKGFPIQNEKSINKISRSNTGNNTDARKDKNDEG